MAFGGFDQRGAGRSKAVPMSEINMTPLIDVMLVLLVIFIITAPLLTHAIRLDLPRVAAASAPETRRTVTVTINAAGQLYWNDKAISLTDLRARMADEGRSPEPAELHLRADQASRYQMIAAVMSAAQRAGLSRIGFVTEPLSTNATPPDTPPK